MKIYIVEGSTGEWEDIMSFKIGAFFSKKKAEAYCSFLERFIPPWECSEALERACRYELTRLEIMYSWKEHYEDVPILSIDEVKVLNEDYRTKS